MKYKFKDMFGIMPNKLLWYTSFFLLNGRNLPGNAFYGHGNFFFEAGDGRFVLMLFSTVSCFV
jgi:hypothetical protein